ncbi:MAG TPA: hypothetical protein VFN97_26190 [Actinospica sp.]|nr:hypothetical protein [Actinospica sp.]
MSEQGGDVSIGYAFGQWTKALHASVDTDPEVREHAAARMRRWQDVIRGMADGSVVVGDRTPVKDLPAWVTLEVLHGGFATGRALAETPVDDEEAVLAARHGIPADRAALFVHHLSREGQEELRALMHDGGYRIAAPENAALPVLAWLVANGRAAEAEELVGRIAPLAARLRFTPIPSPTSAAVSDDGFVFRETVRDVRDALDRRRPNRRVATMNEALTVWNPFSDEVLSWWLESVGDRAPGEVVSEAWLDRGRELSARYRALAAEHTLCGKHRNPKQNLALLLSCLETVIAGEELDARRRGRLRPAVESMVRRRGVPGEERHRELRDEQAAQSELPTGTDFVRILADRLGDLPQQTGIADIEHAIAPVDALESIAHPRVPEGAAIPASLERIVRRATAAPVDRLVDLGLIGSSEVLAALLPHLTARTFAASFPDPELRALMAELYRAFRSRRSLLLVNLQHQVRISELPWVAALSGVRTGSARTEARETLRELGALALSGFPATQIPNKLVTEFAALSRAAELDVPWVEELAADIFMGVFSPKFERAARLAGGLLAGSVYERYYGIDYPGLLATPEPDPTVSGRRVGYTRVPGAFDKLCIERADRAGRNGVSVASQGMVIEQAQILTTHNLAALAGPCGVRPRDGWQHLAGRAFTHMLRLARQLPQARRPLPLIKDLAYAWRQILFYLSMPDADVDAFLFGAHIALAERGPAMEAMLSPVLDGLDAIAHGGAFDASGRVGDGYQFTGWSTGGHWLRGRRVPDDAVR